MPGGHKRFMIPRGILFLNLTLYDFVFVFLETILGYALLFKIVKFNPIKTMLIY